MAKGLGKGLEGLFEDNLRFDETSPEGLRTVRLALVEPNRDQPRKTFDEAKINELAQSIKQNGVLQPLIVRETAQGRYQIISGERRWRAARAAGLEEIPVLVKTLDEQQVLEIGLIENLQREDLNAVEEARGYRTLMDDFGLTQEKVAEKVSKSRSAVANALRLLALPDKVLDMVADGTLSAGHARALLPLAETRTADELIKTAKDVADKGLSVRAVENLSKTSKKPEKKPAPVSAAKAAAVREVETKLSRKYGRKVTVTQDGADRGKVSFSYTDADDLNNLLEQLS